MLYTDVIYFFELELLVLILSQDVLIKYIFGDNCLNVYFPRFASTTPLLRSL